MEESTPALLILMAVVAFVAYVLHQRWFDRHPWPGSTRGELDGILQRNHAELVKMELEDSTHHSKADENAEKEKLNAARVNLKRVMQVRGVSFELPPSAPDQQQSERPQT